jgi:long-chain acyl-CoA synthetase
LPGLFRERVLRTPRLTAYRQFDRNRGEWRSFSWQQTSDLVARWQRALAALRLAPGDRVAVQLRNCLEWVCYEQAAMALGLVVVPLYPNDSPGNLAYILNHSGSRVLLVDTMAQWQALAPVRERLPARLQVVTLQRSETATASDPSVGHAVGWLNQGGKSSPSAYESGPDELASIVYTSGTTGRPKGVMLSHRNILWNAQAQLEMVPTYHEDTFLSVLPLSHAFERTVGYYLPMMAGSCVAYARSPQALKDDLLTVRPSVLVSVPRIYEKAYARIQDTLVKEGRPERALFRRAVEIGWAGFLAEQGRRAPLGLADRLRRRLLRSLVAVRILNRFGGRLRIAVSGAAPLPAAVARCFLGLGLNLVEGYGLTEAAPTVTANPPRNNLPGSAGLPIPGVRTRFADNGELVVKSPGVMLGYWKRPQDTRSAIDAEGWLHTGDIAQIRGERIFIRGRIKEILVMFSGKKTAAGDLERAITADALFENVLVVGEGRPFLTALLVLEPQGWKRMAADLSLDATDSRSLRSPRATRAVKNRIAGLLREFPAHAQVLGVCLLLEPWTRDNGLLTPTLKVKREEGERRFAAEIDGLYRSSRANELSKHHQTANPIRSDGGIP